MLHLDDLDVRIIEEMASPASPQWNVRESYANISRRLGVDEETVRTRIKRARERGFLPAWKLMVNPRIFGCGSAGLDLEVADERRKTEAVSQIKLVDGVTNIVDFHGEGISVLLCYEDEGVLQRRVALIESICGARNTAMWKSVFPKPGLKLRKVDWMVIDSMKDDARKDLDNVAKAVGASTRTVQRRLTVMSEGKAVYLVGAPNPEVIGGLMCNFLVHFSDTKKKRAADRAIYSAFSRIGGSDTSPEQYSTFGMSCENLAEADRVLRAIRTIDGVSDVRMRVMRELIVVQDWLQTQIASRISAGNIQGPQHNA